MSIHVRQSPVTLAWSDFRDVQKLEGKEQAHTDVGFNMENKNFIHADGVYKLADITLTVVPLVTKLANINKTDELLSHEQGHYNIGILVGRAMARELEGLWDKNPHELVTKITKAFDKHRLTLMKPIQDKYDADTEGSLKRDDQKRWDGLIADAMGAATAVITLSNLPL